ncbi:hypothetical protein NMG60_11034939 [Bertholletia excelsa]
MRVFPLKNIATHSTPVLVFQRDKQFLLRRICSNSSPATYLLAHPRVADSAGSPATLEKDLSSGKSSNENSYVVSYLVNSCGLSPEVAISVSSKFSFGSPEKPDSVLNLLKQQGFTKSQISAIVRRRPVLLRSNVKTLLPKFEFFQSIGVSRADLAKTLSFNPTLVTRSLENQLIPCYNFLKSVVQSDKNVIAAMRRTSWIFLIDFRKDLIPNVTLLREIGVPDSSIALLLTHFPEALIPKNAKFREVVNEVKDMGFDPLKTTFVLAVHARSGDNKLTWNRSYEAYRKVGWSNDEIISAFRKHPSCMIISEKKIMNTINFLVKKMGWDYRMIVRCPALLFFNLEKRIIPRCLVIQVLASKGLIKKDMSLSTILLPGEKHFLDRFVTRFEEEVPLLLNVYQGKMDVAEL